MLMKPLQMTRNVVLAMAAGAWAIGGSVSPAHSQHDCCKQGEGNAGHDHGSAGHDHGSSHDAHAGHGHGTPSARPTGQHGGQLAASKDGAFEVVYQPKEIRVYLYGASEKPVSAKGAQGKVTLRVRGHDKDFRYPLKYVAPAADAQGPDYLTVAVDVSRIRDGDMKASFQLTDLPFEQPKAEFTQTFALSRLPVVLAALEKADEARIARQKVCPVMGGELGGMGDPVKVLVGGQPLYLCCKGCLGKVQKNPVAYLQKAQQSAQAKE
jgi:hypothetical protein